MDMSWPMTSPRYVPTPKKLRKSMILDGINPQDFREMKIISACEDCSHFNPVAVGCSLGYNSTPHLRENQQKCYELTGKMAFCRFHEID